MKKILCQFVRDKIIELIKILGFGFNEIVLELNLEVGVFETIEYVEEDDMIVLHIFANENFDMTFDYDELEEIDQLKIYNSLIIYYN